MQCKDIPDIPILEFLARETHEFKWATHWAGTGIMPSVANAMPESAPEKLRLAKMGQLIRRGLADGCTCGCRGDFYITEKGRSFLEVQNCPKIAPSE